MNVASAAAAEEAAAACQARLPVCPSLFRFVLDSPGRCRARIIRLQQRAQQFRELKGHPMTEGCTVARRCCFNL